MQPYFTFTDEIGEFSLFPDFRTETSIGTRGCVIRYEIDSESCVRLCFPQTSGETDYEVSLNTSERFEPVWTRHVGCIPENFYTFPSLTLITSGDRKVIFVRSVDGYESPIALLDWDTGTELTWDMENNNVKEFLSFIDEGLYESGVGDEYQCPERYAHIRVRTVIGNCETSVFHVVRFGAN